MWIAHARTNPLLRLLCKVYRAALRPGAQFARQASSFDALCPAPSMMWRVKRGTAQAADAPTSRDSRLRPNDARARVPTLPIANDALRLVGSKFRVLAVAPAGLSLKSKRRRRVILSSDAECTIWCSS